MSASPAPHLLGRILGKPGPWDLGKALRLQFRQTPAGPRRCFRDPATRWGGIPDRVRRRSEGPTDTSTYWDSFSETERIFGLETSLSAADEAPLCSLSAKGRTPGRILEQITRLVCQERFHVRVISLTAEAAS